MDRGILQVSVLEPLLFIININDLPYNLTHTFMLHANDGKLLVELKTDRDNVIVQTGMFKFYINIIISIHIPFFGLVFQNFSFFKIKTYIKVKQKILHYPKK